LRKQNSEPCDKLTTFIISFTYIFFMWNLFLSKVYLIFDGKNIHNIWNSRIKCSILQLLFFFENKYDDQRDLVYSLGGHIMFGVIIITFLRNIHMSSSLIQSLPLFTSTWDLIKFDMKLLYVLVFVSVYSLTLPHDLILFFFFSFSSTSLYWPKKLIFWLDVVLLYFYYTIFFVCCSFLFDYR
jgi:hypothetical protein